MGSAQLKQLLYITNPYQFNSPDYIIFKLVLSFKGVFYFISDCRLSERAQYKQDKPWHLRSLQAGISPCSDDSLLFEDSSGLVSHPREWMLPRSRSSVTSWLLQSPPNQGLHVLTESRRNTAGKAHTQTLLITVVCIDHREELLAFFREHLISVLPALNQREKFLEGNQFDPIPFPLQ